MGGYYAVGGLWDASFELANQNLRLDRLQIAKLAYSALAGLPGAFGLMAAPIRAVCLRHQLGEA
jgi:hypothetical protein